MSSSRMAVDGESTTKTKSIPPTHTFSPLMGIDQENTPDAELTDLKDPCPPIPDSLTDYDLSHPKHLDTSKWLTENEQRLWRFGNWRDENQQPGVAPSSPVMQSIEDHGPSRPMLGRCQFPWYTPPVRARRLFRYPPTWRFVPVTRLGPGNHGSETFIMFDRQTNTLCHGKLTIEHENQNFWEGAPWADLDHPHIIKHVGWLGCYHPRYCWAYYDNPEDGCHAHPNSPHVPMRMTELVEMGSLTEEIRRTLTGKQVLEIVRQTASALEFMHSQRLVHTDVKPSKILIRSLNPVNIALDLSTSTQEYTDWRSTGNERGIPGRLGTPGWQSRMTEQCGETYHAWDDLWSLGSLILWLVGLPYRKLKQWDWRAQHHYSMELGRLNFHDKLVSGVMPKLINPQPNRRHTKILSAEEVRREVTQMLEDNVYGDEKILLDNNVEIWPEFHEYGVYELIRE